MYRAMVVGCGAIGSGFDAPGEGVVLTHAKAYGRHPRTSLAAVVDADPGRAALAGGKWGCPHYADLDAALAEIRPDIVSVCVPDAAHAGVLRRCLAARPRALVAEKPLTTDPDDSAALARECAEAGVALAVNLSRRYDPFVRGLAARLRSGDMGRALCATLLYTKGVLHNGVHALDLLRQLFGECLRARVLGGRVDYAQADPTLSAALVFQGCENVLLLAGDERAHSLFEADVVAERGRVRLLRSGAAFEEQLPVDDPVYAGYRELAGHSAGETGLHGAMLAMVENVAGHLDDGRALLCPATDAVAAERLCRGLAEAFRAGEGLWTS